MVLLLNRIHPNPPERIDPGQVVISQKFKTENIDCNIGRSRAHPFVKKLIVQRIFCPKGYWGTVEKKAPPKFRQGPGMKKDLKS
jgi:hypothetical protein